MSSAPSMTGIIMSVTTRSGGDSRMTRSAAAPSPAFGHFVPGPREAPPEQETLVGFVIDDENPRHPSRHPLMWHHHHSVYEIEY